MNILILFTMIFLHLVDDYYLQGILAKLKQKSWWEENAPDSLYEYDYIVALVEHAFSWTFMIMLPITIKMIVDNNILTTYWCIAFIVNLCIHTIVDHLKANAKKISLVVDQEIHIYQIIVTCGIMMNLINI